MMLGLGIYQCPTRTPKVAESQTKAAYKLILRGFRSPWPEHLVAISLLNDSHDWITVYDMKFLSSTEVKRVQCYSSESRYSR